MNLLEQIGITKEELVERIVDKALGIAADSRCYDTGNGEPGWQDIPLSSVVDKKIEMAINEIMKSLSGKIMERVEEIIKVKMDLVFSAPFQQVDRWGEAKGPKVSIKDLIADQAQHFWTTSVSRDGKTDGYDRKPRCEWYAKQVMEEFYKSEMQAEVKNLAAAMKAAIPKSIATEISETVAKYLK